MAGKATPIGKQTKKKEKHLKARASQAAKGTGGGPKPQTDTPLKGDRAIVIKGEIPEALAYFLDVYGRLGRG